MWPRIGLRQGNAGSRPRRGFSWLPSSFRSPSSQDPPSPRLSGPSCGKRKPCDTAPPTVAISVPSSGSTATGTVTVAGTASDNGTVSTVHVTVDGTSPQPATGTSSWSDLLNTAAYPDGAHTITATATDAAGNIGKASVSVDVSNTL